jgi:FAD/FMN-containing dehydrogenase
VLADGSIVEASVDSHVDLFWALKGGLKNFGIVTQFKLRTYPIYHCWGGVMVFTPDQTPNVFQALHQYQTTPDKDLYANLIVNLIPTNNTDLLTLIYLKPVEHPAAYAPLYALTPVFQDTGFRTLHQIMALFPPAVLPRWTWYVKGFTPDPSLYTELATIFSSAPEIADMGALQGGTLVAAVQPISANAVLAGRASNAGTGNALGLQAVNQTWLIVTGGWYNAEDDAKAITAVRSIWEKVGAAADAAGATIEYLFMNDANIEQPVIASYGKENVKRLQSVRQEYDPELVFHKLVPGAQKVPL